MSGTALAQQIEEKLAAIESRIAEIDGFSDTNLALEKEKQKLQNKKNILIVTKNSINDKGDTKKGGGMADDKLKEVDDELNKIEARLKELSTYQFLPPSLKQEKDQLTKRQTELSSLRHQVENQQLTAAPTAPAPMPAPTPPKEPKKNDLIGDDYSVDKSDGGGIEEQIPDGDDNEEVKSDKKSEEITLTPKSEKIEEVDFKVSSSAALEIADKIIKSFNEKIKDYDGPDKDYLKGVVEEFSGMISALSDKAKKSGMDDKTRERAIKGRLAIYIKSIESEFEFSELLDDDIKSQIKELAK